MLREKEKRGVGRGSFPCKSQWRIQILSYGGGVDLLDLLAFLPPVIIFSLFIQNKGGGGKGGGGGGKVPPLDPPPESVPIFICIATTQNGLL